ncbi:hypothetical protein C7974DRAFT_373577 [Boeremia exigua]|uniref:uncharacterized protein n=1 Tax=Boeremia exigua TaxID=749465 RepID=UPI001E8D8B62|nr:uncharacterized protein C7974DRAFT_373577 [Boeremia exigua]KAH6639329.1 hypothetical protein C7974DRAFT_373577 [Boeremia exigua]
MIEADLGWNGRTAYSVARAEYAGSISALSFTAVLATLFFTILLNGGVWINASHVQENGTEIATPRRKSRGRGLCVRDVSTGSVGDGTTLSWSNLLHHDQAVRIAVIVHEAIVMAASPSMTIEVLAEYGTTNKIAYRSSERKDLVRFAFVVVPLIWLRNIFIVYDVILLNQGLHGSYSNRSL